MPILFTIAGVHNNINTLGKRLGVGPNFCGGRLLPSVKLMISGVTKDSTGSILGNAVVNLFQNDTDKCLEEVISDEGTGAYSVSSVGLGQNYYVRAYKAGAPDVAGTSRNDLTGTT